MQWRWRFFDINCTLELDSWEIDVKKESYVDFKTKPIRIMTKLKVSMEKKNNKEVLQMVVALNMFYYFTGKMILILFYTLASWFDLFYPLHLDSIRVKMGVWGQLHGRNLIIHSSFSSNFLRELFKVFFSFSLNDFLNPPRR